MNNISMPARTKAKPAQRTRTTTGTTEDTKMIVTVILLVFVYPVGVIVMWAWTSWKTWVKVVVTLPIILGVLFFVLLIVVANPPGQIQNAQNAPLNSSTTYRNHTTAPATTY